MNNFEWRGEWISNIPYNPNQFVTYENILYVSTDFIEATSIPPKNDTAKWDPVVTGSGGNLEPELPYLVLTNDPFIFETYVGDVVSFTKEDYGDQVDEIDTNLAITRGNNQGIYNPYLEPGWDDTSNDGISPLNTLWNKDGWSDLTNVANRRFYTFYEIFDGNIGNNVRNVELVMKDVTNNKYYKFYFTVWGNSSLGAPVTYTRQQIDGITGDNIGGEITFVKNGYDDPTLVNDPIDTDLTIARGNNQGIYNLALEIEWDDQGDGRNSPAGTLWNGDGWSNLRQISKRTFSTFYSVLNENVDENILNKELVMYDTINNKYYAFKFSSWTQNDNGGGFSYTRQLINSSDLFVKPDNDTDTIDIFVEDDGSGNGIGITRGNNQGIYNPYREDGWDSDQSPEGTLWNVDGWDDFSNLTDRIYQPFYMAFGSGGLGNKVPGTKCVMYIPETEQYFAIQFLTWTQNSNGGGFSYLRYELDVTKINEGIKFADGSILKSANDFGKIKSTAVGDRKIQEVSGYSEVSVTSVNYSSNVEATVYQNNNGNFDFYVVDTPELINLDNNRDSWQKIEFSFDNGNTWREAVLSGGNTGVWRQIYFPDDQNYVTVVQDQILLYRTLTGGTPQVWWDKNNLSSGDSNFRGAIINYHAYTGEGTFIGSIYIVDDDGEENITHSEVSSGSTDSENDDLWYVENEGTISYRRMDGESKTLKIHWTATVFYGSEYYD